MEDKKDKILAEYTSYRILIVRLDETTEVYEKIFEKAIAITNFYFKNSDFTMPFAYAGISPDLSCIFYTSALLESKEQGNEEYLHSLIQEIQQYGWVFIKHDLGTVKKDAIAYTN